MKKTIHVRKHLRKIRKGKRTIVRGHFKTIKGHKQVGSEGRYIYIKRSPFSEVPEKLVQLTEEEKNYIIDTFGREPEELPWYEVQDAIEERREARHHFKPQTGGYTPKEIKDITFEQLKRQPSKPLFPEAERIISEASRPIKTPRHSVNIPVVKEQIKSLLNEKKIREKHIESPYLSDEDFFKEKTAIEDIDQKINVFKELLSEDLKEVLEE